MNAGPASLSSADQSSAGVVPGGGDLSPAFVPLSEAARFLGISRSHAYRLADRGEFPVPVMRLGRSRRVAIDALRQLATPAA